MPKPSGGKPKGFQMQRSLQSSKLREFTLAEKFSLGYRNREDITTLPPGVLVQGSQNVVTNQFQRVGIRKGYVLDGQRDTSVNGILSAFDWQMHTGQEQHLRAGYDWKNSNGKLQFRYVANAGDKYLGNTFTKGQVYWIDLLTGLDSVKFNFCDFWDFNHELKSLLLGVNGNTNIYVWSGGVATIKASTATTITKNGNQTWAELGFFNSGYYTQAVLINGNTYTYTGGADTNTLTGVSPSPVGEPIQSVVAQAIQIMPNAGGLPTDFFNTLIANLNNQIYLAARGNQSVYVSAVNSFQDYTFSSPRLVGQGAVLTLDAVPTALISQDTQMFISAGKDYWYQTQFQLSSDNKGESLSVTRLKTTSRQGTQSQGLTTKIKNNIAFVSFEPVFNTLGTAQNYLNDPQTNDLSYPIINDFNSYDFTDGFAFYFNKFVYLSVPKSGLIRVYNMTDDGAYNSQGVLVKNHYWEAPLTMPMSAFSVIDGQLYGHSYQSSNTFKLFTGFNDDGHPQQAIAAFSFENLGIRTVLKNSDAAYTEGYITSNTKLTLTLNRDVGGLANSVSFVIDGANPAIVPPPQDDASLGKVSLGKNSLGAGAEFVGPAVTPPKFRVMNTYNRKSYFEEQKVYSSDGTDQQWEVLAFGTNAQPASEEPTFIYI